MSAERYRFDGYLQELRDLSAQERFALEEMGITGADFLDAFGCAEEVNEAVGAKAAAIWAKHRDLAGAPAEVKQSVLNILSIPNKRSAEAAMGNRVKARLYPQSSVAGPSFRLSAATASPTSVLDSRGTDEHTKLVLQDIFDIYISAGSAGAKWLIVPAGSEERRKQIITMPLARRFDTNQLKTQLNFMKRWSKWCAGVTPPVSPYSPAAIDSAFFLQQHSEGKPTVALNLFSSMKWWTKHVGVPFNVEHSAVAAFGSDCTRSYYITEEANRVGGLSEAHQDSYGRCGYCPHPTESMHLACSFGYPIQARQYIPSAEAHQQDDYVALPQGEEDRPRPASPV